MTNDVAQIVAAELARIVAQNPPTDWLKIVNLIVGAVVALGVPFITYLNLKQNAHMASLAMAVDGQSEQLKKAIAVGERSIGREEGAKEATAKAEIAAATAKAESVVVDLNAQVKSLTLEKPVLNDPVLVNPVTK